MGVEKTIYPSGQQGAVPEDFPGKIIPGGNGANIMVTSLDKVIVVANVCLATCKVSVLLMPHKSAISLRYEFITWLLTIGNRILEIKHFG